MSNRRVCRFEKEDGRPCGSPPLQDGEFCVMHSPEHAEEMAEARRLGGLRRRKEKAVSGVYEFEGFESVGQIRRVLEIATVDTLGLENSVARSRVLAYLVRVALKALEAGEFEERLEALERAIGMRPRRTGWRGKR